MQRWLPVIAWTGVIYATIPLARMIQKWVSAQFGADLRRPRCEESARLAKFRAMEHHIYIVRLMNDEAVVTAIGRQGQELDRTEIRRP